MAGSSKRQRHKIQIALVGLNISALGVSMELDYVASLKNIAGVNRRETVGVHAQDFLIAVVLNALGQPQIALQIEDPRGDAIRVLADQRALAGRDA